MKRKYFKALLALTAFAFCFALVPNELGAADRYLGIVIEDGQVTGYDCIGSTCSQTTGCCLPDVIVTPGGPNPNGN